MPQAHRARVPSDVMWTTQQHAGQLSLFPTGSLVQQRHHHRNRGDRYRVRMGTIQWQIERQLALARDDQRCQNCGSEERLVVHHRTYAHVGDEWPQDLVVLCWSCHEWEHERRAVA